MKNILLVSLLLSVNVLAAGEEVFDSPESLMLTSDTSLEASQFYPGFYVGAQVGWGSDGWRNLKDLYPATKFTGGTGWSGRVMAGFDYTRAFGLEFGYSHFGNMSQVSDTDSVLDKSRTSIVDALMKLTWPIHERFNFYTKTGFGLVHLSGGAYYPQRVNHVDLLYGAGLSYDLNNNLTLDLGVLHFDGNNGLISTEQGTSSFVRYQPATNLVTLGLAYKFTDPAATFSEEVDDPELYGDPFLPGVYLGLQGGIIDTGWRSLNNFKVAGYDLVTKSASAPGARVFIGYDVTRNWALEGGYTKSLTNAELAATNQLADIRTQAFDIVGKLKWPVGEGLAFYAKGGVNYLLSSGLCDGAHTIFAKDKLSHVTATYGLGITYYITPHFIWDISGTRILGNQSLARLPQFTHYQPEVTFLAMGFAYKI